MSGIMTSLLQIFRTFIIGHWNDKVQCVRVRAHVLLFKEQSI